ncbi:MAG TPA: DUF6069 family protein [Pseudonocardiaceae bacterium]|jgi:hypothetical protein|nr:DUF6069 family protein [Pseudonocardiaceae bacterium]
MDYYPQEPPRGRPDPGRLWAGGVATAVVAALVALVGILIARGLVHVAILAPKGEGAWGDASTATYAAGAAICALLATALLHFLMATTPRATSFFGWIMVLITIVAVVVPLSLAIDWSTKIATGLLNLIIGLVIAGLLTNISPMARTRGPQQQAHRYPEDDLPPTRQWDR